MSSDEYHMTLGFKIAGLGLDPDHHHFGEVTGKLLKKIYQLTTTGETIFNHADVGSGKRRFRFDAWKKHYEIEGREGDRPKTKKNFAQWCFKVLKHHNVHFNLNSKLVSEEMDIKLAFLKRQLESEAKLHSNALHHTISTGDKSAYDTFVSFGVEPIVVSPKSGGKYRLWELGLDPSEQFLYNTMMGKNQYHTPPSYVQRSSLTLCVEKIPNGEMSFIFDPKTMSLFDKMGELLPSFSEMVLPPRQLSDGDNYYWFMYQTDMGTMELQQIVKDYKTYEVLVKNSGAQNVGDDAIIRQNFVRSPEYVSFVSRCVQNAQLWFGILCDALKVSTLKNNRDYVRKTIKQKVASTSPFDVNVKFVGQRKVAKEKKILDAPLHHSADTWCMTPKMRDLALGVDNSVTEVKPVVMTEPITSTGVGVDGNKVKGYAPYSAGESDADDDMWSDDDDDSNTSISDVENDIPTTKDSQTKEPGSENPLGSEAGDSEPSKKVLSPSITDLVNEIGKDQKEITSKAKKRTKKEMVDVLSNQYILISPLKNSNVCDGHDCYTPSPLHVPDFFDFSKIMLWDDTNISNRKSESAVFLHSSDMVTDLSLSLPVNVKFTKGEKSYHLQPRSLPHTQSQFKIHLTPLSSSSSPAIKRSQK